MEKIAIVTGASRGIGAATAITLAAQGYAVCVNYNTGKAQAEAVVAEIKNNHGHAIAVQGDIALEKDILKLYDIVDKELGSVTALINNAGTNGGVCEVENISAACLEAVFATNVFGTFYASREAVKRMKKNGGGNIINVTSEAARFGGTNLAHYAASKAAINTFTIGFAREVAPFNIRVNAVSPGVIDTEIHAGSSPERIDNLIKSLPMKRMGKASEVANLIYWLLSDSASYLSGSIIPITGSR
jgi:NAD(P)-dependent dehydrogenase (short-subunit alcohol dehydrogenase family)